MSVIRLREEHLLLTYRETMYHRVSELFIAQPVVWEEDRLPTALCFSPRGEFSHVLSQFSQVGNFVVMYLFN